ncbi:MAG TPA: histidine kinase [Pyrinomonadaceae bacterium]|nr:histidine kinase [Pyrinomonadaceae bacterium]
MPPSTTKSQTVESVDERLVNLTRLILSLSALIIIYVDPSEPDRLVNITYTTLALYTVYSALVYVLSIKRQSLFQNISLHWIDIGWYLILISLSSGTNSLFFFFFFFVILVASFRSGYKAGLKVTIVSSILFVTVGYYTTPTPVEPNRFLLRAVYLASIGYLMAYWGGSETTHKRRLALLKDVSKLSNPRFGVDQTIGSIMSKLRDFYDADTCLLISTGSVPSTHVLRRVDRHHPELANRTEDLSQDEAAPLLAWPQDWAIAWHKSPNKWWFSKTPLAIYHFASGERVRDADETFEWVADLLNANSFLSIPVYQRNTFTGRLYLTSQARRFTYSDIDFLRQVVEHVVPIIEHVRLVDRFASEAFEHERRKISRDIHDSAIQPYIGLKLGLEALRRRASHDDPLAAGIAELVDKTDSVIKDLRIYVGDLQQAAAGELVNVLVSSVQGHARKLGEFYGISVEVDAAADMNVNDRLAAEVFQIVREGLSNIKRHTASATARISMASSNGDLILDIENESPSGETHKTFTPRSITERAIALGGRVSVRVDDTRTIVSVIIPM